MGADLYIKTIRRNRATKSRKKESPLRQPLPSESYFRDSYNMTSVLWTLGLSWWRDVLPLLDANLELKGRELQRFREQVARAEQRLPTAEDLLQAGVRLEKTGERSLKELHRYHIEKRKSLLRFLDVAIENDTPIICSL
jgi:hypothetical protein